MYAKYENKGISIHALVKRATQYDDDNTILANHFNPRPREEGDGRIAENIKSR